MAEIEFSNITKSFGTTQVLHSLNLSIERGAFAVILGPSGCGKSTLLRLLAGLEKVSSGEISIAGRRVEELQPRERDVAMVFQNYALYPHMTVAQNLGYSLRVAGVKRPEIEKRVAEVARTLQLDEYLKRKPGQLSGGQRQRVAMGRAIIREPKVFLFDEPLSNLDAKLRTQMRLEIKRLHRKQGVTSLFVTHDQIEAMTLADILIVMNKGRIEQVGRPADIYEKPASAFVASFLGSPPMNLIPATVDTDNRGIVFGDGMKISLGYALPVAPGTEIVAGIRPEHVEIGNGHIVPVEFAEELGNGRQVHLRIGDMAVSALLSANDKQVIGDALAIKLPSEHLHFFAKDGRVIDVQPTAHTVSKPETAERTVSVPALV
ncbi:sn-glycerol-3-phosphate ABC transporter ATP-binding protein UgpC [Rhizobium sp. XQZ8]|uniref:ABC transporter ATP-binding protein n=1 Tax=Rhizobium populisoli TaxID=2859785 RepID=UPI001CA5509A|nr:sn-glycerol-3-phosphate ABC transporter ATP-binding protein UgpC [Rhizobium populisoli]MBW6424978.1 sn-glycerol-3-phosphate ABC transporter ATP-binding protein UgpC [Rhizobium populisoli]